MSGAVQYDVGIAGGGLAGLTIAIQFKKKGYNVILFEKNTYPFHRVCGEYISNESRNYLSDCGIDLAKLSLPSIKKLQVSAPNGNLLQADLGLGGFGISRYTLDHLLYEEAKRSGVTIMEKTKVLDIRFVNDSYEMITDGDRYIIRVAVGSFGKRSNLDVKWNRNYIAKKQGALNNYIGVKYHIKTDHPTNTIVLHNFKGGYCGMSGIEDDKYCLCYLTTAGNLQRYGSIPQMEKQILSQNPHLKKIFEQSEFLFEKPVSISQISFDVKEVIYNKIPLAGDACGMITPLCGNGMSMAMHAGKILSEAVDAYLKSEINLGTMLQLYRASWEKQFSQRLRTGRLVQKQFGKVGQTNFFISLLKTQPWLVKKIIRATHGEAF